jgi:ubiquinone/menaquinone biosynthesis C-methylase UbiE
MSPTPGPDVNFGRLALAYDRVRPADENWRRVYDRVVARAGLRGARVLDVGCGTGRLSLALAEEQAARVWGVDVSPEMLAVARAKAPRLRFKEARAEALPFKDAWFEAVVFWLVVHLVDRTAAFAEARRVLAPDGRVAVVSFHESHFDRYWLNEYFPSLERIDRARFPTQAELERELRDAGFDAVDLERVTGRMSLTRAEAIDKLEQRHISTFDLLPPDEVEAGVARARRELPSTVEYALEFLVAVAQA